MHLVKYLASLTPEVWRNVSKSSCKTLCT